MRRAIVIVASVALLLAVGAVPAAGVGAPHNIATDTWCDMDGDPNTGSGTVVVDSVEIDLAGFETYFEVDAWNVPGWIPGVHAPVIWFGGHFRYYEDGELLGEGDLGHTPPGMASRVTTCVETVSYGGGLTVWDPLRLFFTPPAVP